MVGWMLKINYQFISQPLSCAHAHSSVEVFDVHYLLSFIHLIWSECYWHWQLTPAPTPQNKNSIAVKFTCCTFGWHCLILTWSQSSPFAYMYAYLCGVSKMFTEQADLKSDTTTVTLTCTSLVKSHGSAMTVTYYQCTPQLVVTAVGQGASSSSSNKR